MENKQAVILGFHIVICVLLPWASIFESRQLCGSDETKYMLFSNSNNNKIVKYLNFAKKKCLHCGEGDKGR